MPINIYITMNNEGVIHALSLLDFFKEDIQNIPNCSSDTKSYILQVLKEPEKFYQKISGKSITLLYADASLNFDFKLFQMIGDFLLFSKGILPNSLNGASLNYYNNIAISSYRSCHLLLQKQWPLFAELASNFLIITKYIQSMLEIKIKENEEGKDELIKIINPKK